MKNKTVPLVKISSDESIYFDLSNNQLFVQKFDGPFTEKNGSSYSGWNVVLWVLMGSLLFTPILYKQINFLSNVPTFIIFFIFVLFGIVGGVIFSYLVVEKSKSAIKYRALTKKEMRKIKENRTGAIIICFVQLFMIMMLVYKCFDVIFWGRLPNFWDMGDGFIISLLNFSVYPFRYIKATVVLRRRSKVAKISQ